MLVGLGNARNLTFDSQSIEELSKISNYLVSLPSPFRNLTYVKLPRGYKESSIPSALRSFLLSGSSRARIVTELPQGNVTPQTATVSVTAENAALEEPVAAPTKGLADYQYIDKIVCVDTVDMGIQEQHVVENSLIDADRVNQVSTSKGETDLKLWCGYQVKSEFVCLLDRIMQKHPETFEIFTTKNKKSSTVRLNMLCTSLNDFTKLSLAEVDSEIIVQHRDIFSNLQSQGFNLSWVLSHLDYIQHLRLSDPLITEVQAIDCRIANAKSEVKDLQALAGDAIDKLKNLQTLRAQKMAEIEKEFGPSGTNLALGLIGHDLRP